MTESTSDMFQQRRALDLAFDALAKTTSEAELVQGAHAIVDEFPGALTMAALLKRLDTPNSQLRGGLARLATFLPEVEIVQALQEYAGNRAHPAQGRVTAAMICERFLGKPLRPGTLSDLQGNEDAAVQSLRDAVQEGEEDLRVLVEYSAQMQAYPIGIAHQVMQHLDAMSPMLRVNLLMLIAADPRPQSARSALERLEQLAEKPDLSWPQNAPENSQRRAQRALHVLIPNLAPLAAASAERVLRKAQFRGSGYTPPPERLRCFLGMPHFSSAYTLEFWQFGETRAAPVARLALMLQSDMGFVAGDFAEDTVPKEYWNAPPDRSAIRRLSSGNQTTWHVEIPPEAGRWLLAREVQAIVEEEKVDVHSAASPERLPDNYLAALLWLWDAPRLVPNPLWLAIVEGERSPIAPEVAQMTADTLIHLPAMAHWNLLDAVLSGPQRSLYRGKLRDEIAPIFFAQIAAPEVQAVLVARMQAALRMAALWLYFAGDESLANATADLAFSIGAWSPEENPLLRKMLGV